MYHLALGSLVFLGLAAVGLGKEQGVAVRGQLICNGHSLQNVVVKLFDTDTLPGDADDLMADGYSGPSGIFYLNGTTSEITIIEPEVRIYHDCNNRGKPCKRKIVRRVPEQFIYDASTDHPVYNMGVLELSQPFENEEKSCEGAD